MIILKKDEWLLLTYTLGIILYGVGVSLLLHATSTEIYQNLAHYQNLEWQAVGIFSLAIIIIIASVAFSSDRGTDDPFNLAIKVSGALFIGSVGITIRSYLFASNSTYENSLRFLTLFVVLFLVLVFIRSYKNRSKQKK